MDTEKLDDVDDDQDDEEITREKIEKTLDLIRNLRADHPDLQLDLERANLRGLDLHGLDFRVANMREAQLSHADLSNANLRGVDLGQATLIEANLEAADLREAYLYRANLFGAQLFRAQLQNADLSGARVTGAGLARADFSNCDFRETQFQVVNMRGCILDGANMLFAVFHGADFRDTDFSGAILDNTIFAGVDLSGAVGLKDVTHNGPSHIDGATFRETAFHEPANAIPREFLTGCGLQKWEIEQAQLYQHHLDADTLRKICENVFNDLTRGMPMRRAFISYSHADQNFVDKLHKRLKNESVVVWLDKHELSAGSLQKQINRAISDQDVVILVLSESSLGSDWVENELEMARNKEKDEGRDVLCPIAIDDSWADQIGDNNHPNRALWRKLRDKYIVDFSKWRTKAFETSFEKLVSGLRLNYDPKTP